MANTEILDKVYNQIEAQQSREYFLFHQHRYKLLLELIQRYTNKQANILDIGFAYGHILSALLFSGYKNLHGIDMDYMVNLAKKQNIDSAIELQKCNLEVDIIPYVDNYFDLIIFTETLEHLNFHPNKVFMEINRVLKKDGIVIITTPNLTRLNNRIKLLFGKSINSDLSQNYSAGTHYREYNIKEIKYLFKSSKLKVESVKFVNFDYPLNKFIYYINKFIGYIFPSLKTNIVIIGKK